MTEESTRPMPGSELDLNLMLTDSVWGREEISTELKQRLQRYRIRKTEDGQTFVNAETQEPVVDTDSLWSDLGFFTRDMRLANLSRIDNELYTCRYMIDLANDFLSSNMLEPFIICLARAASILETSQSKGGFLRKAMNTLIQKNISGTEEAPKKSLWGGKKKKEGEY